MNRKIFDFIILILSAVGAVYAVFDQLIDIGFDVFFEWLLQQTQWLIPGLVPLTEPYLKMAIRLVFVALVLLLVFFLKKTFTDLFTVLYSMAKNNKLHTLRELVMITHDRKAGKHNKFHIKEGEFVYRISRSESSDGDEPTTYDVRYTLSFTLSKPWYIRMTPQNRFFRFYLICDSENAPTDDTTQVLVDKINQGIAAVIDKVTVRGESGDQIEEFSGLRQAKMVLPPHIHRKSKIKVDVSYDIKSNINRLDKMYNFVIIPSNYGKKMRRMKIKIETPDTKVFCPELQFTGWDGAWETVEYLLPSGADSYETEIQPNMKSAYFVQFHLFDKSAI